MLHLNSVALPSLWRMCGDVSEVTLSPRGTCMLALLWTSPMLLFLFSSLVCFPCYLSPELCGWSLSCTSGSSWCLSQASSSCLLSCPGTLVSAVKAGPAWVEWVNREVLSGIKLSGSSYTFCNLSIFWPWRGPFTLSFLFINVLSGPSCYL